MFLGVEIGGTKLQIVAATADGGITRRWRGTVQQELGGVGIRRQIEQAVQALFPRQSQEKILGGGIGFGGPVDWRTGKICKSHQIAGWENFPLGDWFAELIQAPVAVDNDANVAALGEARRGAGLDADPVFYITLGSGVGGGLIVRGQIYHGLSPGEAEFGHLQLDRHGTTVESRCSGWAVDFRIRAVANKEPTTLLARLINKTPGGEARFLAEAFEQGDIAARRIVQEVADDLAFAISHVVHLFHPQAIVLGGGLSLIGKPLRLAVEAALPAFLMHAFLPAPPVHLAKLGEDAVPLGAIELAREQSETPAKKENRKPGSETNAII